MKTVILRYPELAGVLLGLLDAVPRLVAAAVYAPSEASIHGWLLLGNVHQLNGPKGLGLHTLQWFGVAAVFLLLFYVSVQATVVLLRPVNGWFLVARGALGAVAGVLLLNVLESLASGKVTDYIGWVIGTRFTAINLGDLLVWCALPVFLASFVIGLALRLLQAAPARA